MELRSLIGRRARLGLIARGLAKGTHSRAGDHKSIARSKLWPRLESAVEGLADEAEPPGVRWRWHEEGTTNSAALHVPVDALVDVTSPPRATTQTYFGVSDRSAPDRVAWAARRPSARSSASDTPGEATPHPGRLRRR